MKSTLIDDTSTKYSIAIEERSTYENSELVDDLSKVALDYTLLLTVKINFSYWDCRK